MKKDIQIDIPERFLAGKKMSEFLLQQPELQPVIQSMYLAEYLSQNKPSARNFFVGCMFLPQRATDFKKQGLAVGNLEGLMRRTNARAGKELIKKVRISHKKIYYYLDYTEFPYVKRINYLTNLYRFYLWYDLDKQRYKFQDDFRKEWKETYDEEFKEAMLYMTTNKDLCTYIEKNLYQKYKKVKIPTTEKLQKYYINYFSKFKNSYSHIHFLNTNWNLYKIHTGSTYAHRGQSAILKYLEDAFIDKKGYIKQLSEFPFEKVGLPSYEKQQKEFMKLVKKDVETRMFSKRSQKVSSEDIDKMLQEDELELKSQSKS